MTKTLKSAKTENLETVAGEMQDAGMQVRYYGHEKRDGIVVQIGGVSYVLTGCRELKNEDARNWDVSSNEELKSLKAADKEQSEELETETA